MRNFYTQAGDGRIQSTYTNLYNSLTLLTITSIYVFQLLIYLAVSVRVLKDKYQQMLNFLLWGIINYRNGRVPSPLSYLNTGYYE